MERNARSDGDEGADQIPISTYWFISRPENRSELDRKVDEMFDEGICTLIVGGVAPRPNTVPPRRRS